MRFVKKKIIIGLSISRINYIIFSYIMDGMSKDKSHWLTRKINTVLRFEMSTLEINKKLDGNDELFYKKYGLDKNKYVITPGAVPIFTEENGLVAVIAVTGLKPEEDHKIIIDTLEKLKKEVKYGI